MTRTPEQQAYDHRHYVVERARGRARLQLCVRCLERGTENSAGGWATIHGTDGEDPWADYVALCDRCHCGYDDTGFRGPHTEASRQKMSEAHKLAYANGKEPGRWNADKTHCPAEHEYTEKNTYQRPDGGRDCRKCMARRNQESRARRKQRGG